MRERFRVIALMAAVSLVLSVFLTACTSNTKPLISLHTHEYGSWTTVAASSCSIEGAEKRICPKCGEEETRTIPATAHTIRIDDPVDATCTAEGLTEGSHCSVCGEIVVAQTAVPKLDHIFRSGVCELCGAAISLTASHDSGFYSDEIDLALSTNADATIYYTLDSSTPDSSSLVYTQPIAIRDNSDSPNVYSSMEGISSMDVYIPESNVDKCVVVNAVAITESGDASDVISKVYFIGYDGDRGSGYENLPIVSLVIDPTDLYDYETGIYVTGRVYDESEHEGYPETYPANYNQKGKEWERAAHFTYFEDDHSYSFDQEIGVRIHGGWSRAFNQKSFNLYARKEYSGTKTFEKPFFDTEKMQTCMLRSGGYRDTFITKTRDSLNQDMSKDELFAVQNSYPCVLFLNGEYWGIYNLQERFTEYYVEEHYGVDKDNVVIIENGEVDEGESEDIALYEELVNFFEDNDFSDADSYEKVHQYIDVEEFAAYIATELYVGNIDWPGNNVRMWRARETSDSFYEDGRWHFMMYDTDDSSNILNHMCSYDSDPFTNETHWKYGPLDERCILGLMLSKLTLNDDFKDLFMATFKRIGSENFAPEKVGEYLDERIELLSDPMILFYQRFVSEDTSAYGQEYFLSEMDTINEFFENRYSFAVDALERHVAKRAINQENLERIVWNAPGILPKQQGNL